MRRAHDSSREFKTIDVRHVNVGENERKWMAGLRGTSHLPKRLFSAWSRCRDHFPFPQYVHQNTPIGPVIVHYENGYTDQKLLVRFDPRDFGGNRERSREMKA